MTKIFMCGLTAASLFFAGGTAFFTSTVEEEDGADLNPVEVSTVGLDLLTRTPIVLLRHLETGRIVPIWVGLSEAQAIARALHGVKMPRPMTHDLMASLLSELEAEVEEVVVYDLREGMYLGKIRFKRKGETDIREVESRPSDAMALALRVGAPIRIARGILEKSPDYEFLAPEGLDHVVQALGITVVEATPELREQFGLAADREGVVVSAVSGAARTEGLKRGDLLLRINQANTVNPMQFMEEVRKIPVGQPVELHYLRGGEERSVEIPYPFPRSPRPGSGEGTIEV